MEIDGEFSVCKEYSISSGFVPPRSYILSPDGFTLTVDTSATSRNRRNTKSFISTCKQTLAEIFLPYGYPDSVSEDYLAYQFWDTIQAFCSSLVGTLATHAVLTGLGVGSEDATPMAATLTWLAKDGLGMVGRITFVWLRGTDLDNDLKRWRFVADILNDAAFFIDMLSAVVPRFLFTPMVCLSSASRAIVGVAGGATRTALVQHQARRGNAADVTAKDGSQETIVNLTALICGLILVPAIEGKHMLVWLLYALLTIGHLYANYRAVKSLRLRTFNDKRLAIVADHFLQNGKVAHVTSSQLIPVPGINFVNKFEPILSFTYGYGCDVRIGVSLAEFFDSFNWRADVWSKLRTIFQNDQFVLVTNSSKQQIRVVLARHADSGDVIFCGYLCYVLSHSSLLSSGKRRSANDISAEIEEMSRVYREVQATREEFAKSAKHSGWSFNEHNLTIAGQYRFEQDLRKST